MVVGHGGDSGGGKFAGLLRRSYLPAMANSNVQMSIIGGKVVMLAVACLGARFQSF